MSCTFPSLLLYSLEDQGNSKIHTPIFYVDKEGDTFVQPKGIILFKTLKGQSVIQQYLYWGGEGVGGRWKVGGEGGEGRGGEGRGSGVSVRGVSRRGG